MPKPRGGCKLPERPPENEWERQPREGAGAYAAFAAFRDLDPAIRTYREAALVVGKSQTMMGRWGATWQWQQRALAWDQHRDRVAQAAREREIAAEAEKWQRRANEDREYNWTFGRRLKEQAAEMLDQPIVKTKKSKDGTPVVVPAKWTKATLIAMVKQGDDLCSKATLEGMDDLRGVDVASMTPEEAKAILARQQVRQQLAWKPGDKP